MKRKALLTKLALIVVIAFACLAGGNAALASEKPIEITVALPPSHAPFTGFTAELGRNGKVTTRVFHDPGIMAAALGLRADQVLASSADESLASASSSTGSKTRDGVSVLGTNHQARIDAFAKITDYFYATMNRLDSHHTFNYNHTNVTGESGWSQASWLSASGWFLYWGPRFYFSPYALPRTSDWAKADAGYRNITLPGGPYQNSLLIQTTVYGSGAVGANYYFGIDAKGPANKWRWWGGYSRTQIY